MRRCSAVRALATRMPVRTWLLLPVLVLSSCGSGDRTVRAAIRQLDGPPAQQRRAAMTLRLSSRDPVPDLVSAVQRERNSRRLRAGAAQVLGDLARRGDDLRAKEALAALLDHEDPWIQRVAAAGLRDTGYEPAIRSLNRLARAPDPELRRDARLSVDSIVKAYAGRVETLWGDPEAATAAYAEAAAQGAGRGLMGLSRARFLDRRGRYAEAEELLDQLGVVRRWWLIGTFPNRQGLGFSQVFPPEREINLTNTYGAASEPVRWYRMEEDPPAAELDFESYFVEIDNAVAYALVFILSDREQPVEIRAGSDDTLTLFFNDEIVWSREEYRAMVPDDDFVEVTLREGRNTLLAKVCEEWGAWQLILRLTGPGDTPLEGVRYSLDPGDAL